MADPVRISNLTGRAVARYERQKDKQGPFDVWTNTFDGLEKNRAAQNPDPVAQLREDWDAGVKALSVTADPSQMSSSSHEHTVDAFIANSEGVGDAVYKITEAKGALQTFGASFGAMIALEQALSVPFSMIPFPAFPAVRITDTAVGLPHAHNHPPNLTPPNPVPVPLPSAGPVIPIPFISGAATVLINNMPAGRCGDMGMGIFCGGFFPMYEIFLGSSSVWLEGARAARIGIDITKHCIFSTPKPSDPPMGPMVGSTVSASANVLIGGVPMPSLTGMAMAKAFSTVFKGLSKLKGMAKAADDVAEEAAEAVGKAGDDVVDNIADDITQEMAIPPQVKAYNELDGIAKAVNPENGTVNCGKIIDAVIDRLTGKNADAVAPGQGRNGSWAEIEARHGTTFEPSSFDDVYKAVEDGGDGTTALVGVHYKNGDCHVVVITNKDGVVGIVEGQGGGAVHTSPDAAKAAYGSDSTVTKGMLGDDAAQTQPMQAVDESAKTQEMDAFDPDKTQEMDAFDPDKTQEMDAFDPAKTQVMDAFDPDKTQEMDAVDDTIDDDAVTQEIPIQDGKG